MHDKIVVGGYGSNIFRINNYSIRPLHQAPFLVGSYTASDVTCVEAHGDTIYACIATGGAVTNIWDLANPVRVAKTENHHRECVRDGYDLLMSRTSDVDAGSGLIGSRYNVRRIQLQSPQ